MQEKYKAPSKGLLMSMAIRSDHGLAVPGYYDQIHGPGHHRKRLESTMSAMHQLWEEVTGNGFYSPELEESYVKDYEEVMNYPDGEQLDFFKSLTTPTDPNQSDD